MAVYALGDLTPKIHETAYVHPDATVIGNVVLGAGSSVWPQAVIRGDDGPIVIGENTSIQDGAVIHTTAFTPTRIGSNVTVGHLAHLEGCIVHDWALVGSGSIVLHNAVIHEHALVGGAAMVPGGVEVPRCSMALGVPAKIREGVLDEFHARLNVDAYVARGEQFRTDMRRID